MGGEEEAEEEPGVEKVEEFIPNRLNKRETQWS